MHLCKFLHQTVDDGMFIKRSPDWEVANTNVIAISDAGGLANSKEDSRTVIGFIILIEGNIIAFKSKMTNCVSTDAAHSELLNYYAATKAIVGIDNFFIALKPIFI